MVTLAVRRPDAAEPVAAELLAHRVHKATDGAMSSDQVITPEMARAIHADAVRGHALVGWVVWEGEDQHQGKLVARLVTGSSPVYVLVADKLGELRATLPPGLERSERQPADPPGVIELWW